MSKIAQQSKRSTKKSAAPKSKAPPAWLTKPEAPVENQLPAHAKLRALRASLQLRAALEKAGPVSTWLRILSVDESRAVFENEHDLSVPGTIDNLLADIEEARASLLALREEVARGE